MTFVLILISIAGLAACGFYFLKNLKAIELKNQSEKSAAKRILNYPFTI